MATNIRYLSSEPYNKRDRGNCIGGISKFHSRWSYSKYDNVIKQSPPNNILRLTILNSIYPVTTETLHYAFSSYGNVLRIVLFEKEEILSAMLEFDAVHCNKVF